MATNKLIKLLLIVTLLPLQNTYFGCASHHLHHHAHFSKCLYAQQPGTVTCLRTVTQPTVTETVPVTNFATITNTASTYTIITPTPVQLTEMSTITLSTTISTITPSTTITSITTNTVTSTPPLVPTTISTTGIILVSSTVVVRTTVTTTSTSSIISTRTSRIPVCN